MAGVPRCLAAMEWYMSPRNWSMSKKFAFERGAGVSMLSMPVLCAVLVALLLGASSALRAQGSAPEVLAPIDSLSTDTIGFADDRLYAGKGRTLHRWTPEGWRTIVDTQNDVPRMHTSRATGKLYATGDRVLWRIDGDSMPVVATFGGAVQIAGSAARTGGEQVLVLQTVQTRMSLGNRATWDDSTLKLLGDAGFSTIPGTFRDVIRATIDDDGRVFVIGSMLPEGASQALPIALRRWENGAWASIPGLAGLDDAELAWDGRASRLIVAGDLTITATGQRTRIAAWDGSAWRRVDDAAINGAAGGLQLTTAVDGTVFVVGGGDARRLGVVEGDAIVERARLPDGAFIDRPTGLALDRASGEIYLRVRPDGSTRWEVLRIDRQGSVRRLGLRANRGGVKLLPDDARNRAVLLGGGVIDDVASLFALEWRAGRWAGIASPPGAAHPLAGETVLDRSSGALVRAERDPASGTLRVWRHDAGWSEWPSAASFAGAELRGLAARDGRALVLGQRGDTSQLSLWNGSGWQGITLPAADAYRLPGWAHGDDAPTLAALLNGRWTVQRFDGATWSMLAELPANESIVGYAFDGRGGTLVVASGSRVWRRLGATLSLVATVPPGLDAVVATSNGVAVMSGGSLRGLVGACGWLDVGAPLVGAPAFGAVGDGGRYAYGLTTNQFERRLLPASDAQGLAIDSNEVVVQEGGPEVVLAPSATLCPDAPAPRGVDLTIVGGSSDESEQRLDRLIAPPATGFESTYDPATRTLRLRPSAGAQPSVAAWQSLLRSLRVGTATRGVRFDWRVDWSMDIGTGAPVTATTPLTFEPRSSAPRLRVTGIATGQPTGVTPLTVLDVEHDDGLTNELALDVAVVGAGLQWVASPGVLATSSRAGELRLRGTAQALSNALRGGAVGVLTAPGHRDDLLVEARVRDSDGGSDRTRFTVVFGVAQPLRLRPDEAYVRYGSAATRIDVLGNDLVDSAGLAQGRIDVARSPQRGAVAWDTMGTPSPEDDVALYTPFANASGEDRWSYRVCASGVCREAHVFVEIGPSNVTQTLASEGGRVDRGALTFGLGRWAGWTDARYDAFGPVAVQRSRINGPALAWWADLEEALATGAGPRWARIAPGTEDTTWRLDAAARAVNSVGSADLQVYVGVDDNRNGLAEPAELRCVGHRTSVIERQCAVSTAVERGRDLAWWAVVLDRNPIATPVDLELAQVPLVASMGTLRPLVATGPATLPVEQNVEIKVIWNVPSLDQAEAAVGWVRVVADDSRTVGWQRVRLERRDVGGHVGRAHVIPYGSEYALRVPPQSTAFNLRIDVPAGARRLSLSAPPDSGVALALSRGGRVVSGGASVAIDVPEPGFWQVSVRNPSGTAAEPRLVAMLEGTAPEVRGGGYFNPDRPGHGLFLYPAGTQVAGLFYTYDERGQPTWYYLQGDAPAAHGVFRPTLYRSAWALGRNRLVPIGEAVVSPTGPDAFAFSYMLDGNFGRQSLVSFGRGCPSAAEGVRDASGLWFDPRRSGTGYSVQLLPNYEFFAYFGYDRWGVPRFAVAEAGDVGGLVRDVPLVQLQGQPLLFGDNAQPQSAPARNAVGVLRRTFAGTALSAIEIDAASVSPLEYLWSATEQVVPLGPTQGCAP